MGAEWQGHPQGQDLCQKQACLLTRHSLELELLGSPEPVLKHTQYTPKATGRGL